MNQMDLIEATGQVIENIEDRVFDMIREHSKLFMNLMSYYRCAMLEIETKFKVLDEEYSLAYNRNPISTIKTRLKSVPSIKGKLRKLGVPLTAESVEENLSDVAGVRVICMSIEDVYELAEALLKQDDVTLIKRKDYIANPKENGYRSLHLIVETPIFLTNEKKMMRVEIQLRTIAMDCWASLEHQLRYKNDSGFKANININEELWKCAELSAELDGRMTNLVKQSDLFEEQNYDGDREPKNPFAAIKERTAMLFNNAKKE